MDSVILVEIIKIIPSIFKISTILIVFLLFYKQIKYDLLPRLIGLKLLGVEANFIEEELNRVVQIKTGNNVDRDHTNVIKRARLAFSVLRGAKVLWVDDKPGNNISEQRILHSLGIFLDIAGSTDEALPMIKKVKYDTVIYNNIKGNKLTEVIDFIARLKKENLMLTIIYYGTYDKGLETPKEIFAITNRADHLIHFLIDILERERS